MPLTFLADCALPFDPAAPPAIAPATLFRLPLDLALRLAAVCPRGSPSREEISP